MRVELHIDESHPDPHAVLYIRALSPGVQTAIELLEKDGEQPWLMGQRDGRYYVIDPASVEIVRTEGRELVLYDGQRQRYVLNRPLYELQNRLGNEFVRVSKSALVRLRAVHHVEPSLNGTMTLVMRNGIKDVISRSCRQEFKARLGV